VPVDVSGDDLGDSYLAGLGRVTSLLGESGGKPDVVKPGVLSTQFMAFQGLRVRDVGHRVFGRSGHGFEADAEAVTPTVTPTVTAPGADTIA
jgi:hypothetical protein